MSTSSGSNSDASLFDAEELFHIEERCRELRKEKDLLKETQSQSFDLIKRLDLHVRRLNEARIEDKKQIQDLQRELNNCHQEIDYLQDQLNGKNTYTDSLEEHINNLTLQLSTIDIFEKENLHLRSELNKSNTMCEFLTQELKTKETDFEKLEEFISSTALEYECEIETMRLEMMTLEQKVPDSHRLIEYENVVKKLKDELKEEKLRAKEESEDLTQEMAELRYQLTELLEEERKKRSYVEQASIQRISELETQLQIERQKLVAVSRGIFEP